MIAIIYLGKRGGGEKLLRDLSKSKKIDFNECTFFISKALTDRFIPPANASVIGIKTFRYPAGSILQLPRLLKAILVVKAELNKRRISKVLFLMPHPWDLFISHGLSRKKFRIYRCIHDINPHPGEFFPPRSLVRALIKRSDYIVTFSEYIKHQIPYGKAIISSRLPHELESINYSLEKQHDILFVGRLYSYKGLSLLPEISEEIYKIGRSLSIIGSGNFPGIVPRNNFFHNGWLSDEDFIQHISKAKLIILPYIEASQSGIAAIAVKQHVPIIVMPVGGLPEMINDWDCGEISEDLSVHKFLEAIKLSASKEYSFRQIAGFDVKEFDEVIMEIEGMN
jgi:glycosyltransferase involved in cell wall biosynthesis